MTREIIKQTIRNQIVTDLLHGQDRGLDDTTPLLEWGIIDSLKLVELTVALEKSFSIQISPDDVTPQHFGSINALADLVVGYTARK